MIEVLMICIGLFFLLTSPIVFAFILMNKRFTNSTYKKETGNSFMKVMRDKGLLGEYFTAKTLDKLPGYHKTLVNAYIPNGKGGTTEVDIIYVHETGIYVLESKNYSGWIFGKESDKQWMQTFPNGHKVRFYNPIKQNEGHMKALKSLLPDVQENQFKSMIVFSERCELKKITIDSRDILVFKRNKLERTIKDSIKNSEKAFTKEQIDAVYNKIKAFSNVSDDIKEKHIEQIEEYKRDKVH